MNIVEMGASILSEKLGVDLDPNAIAPALNSLLANDSGELDLAGLAGKMASSGNLGSVISSWLGDGANDAISAESIGSLFGDKLGPFAQQLGVSSDDAASGLASALPEIMDKSSSGGSLLEMAGGASGLLSAASSLFSK